VEFPTATGRGLFREVLLKQDLAKALRRVNLRPTGGGEAGKPWLDKARVSQAVSALERIGTKRLIEATRKPASSSTTSASPAISPRRWRPTAPTTSKASCKAWPTRSPSSATATGG
ncbi:MAG: hypothetical protein V3T72_03875, partial [Thermoanaerobaculia bacterium]